MSFEKIIMSNESAKISVRVSDFRRFNRKYGGGLEMLRVIVSFLIVFSFPFVAHADTSQFEGLYYPPDDLSGVSVIK